MKAAEMLDKITQTVHEPADSDSSVYSDLEMEEESSSESGDEEMYPNLTAGAINRILSFEDVPGRLVLQIIACKKIPGLVSDRYRLLISDGVTGCPFAMLGSQLNQMVTNKELEKFTIVRVDKCVCNEVQPGRKIILLLGLTVLVPGNEVNDKLGNPVLPQSTDAPPTNNSAPSRPSTNGRSPSMYDETRPIR